MQTGQNVVEGQYGGVKVFSATKFEDRHTLGDFVSRWIKETKPTIVSTVVTQSSDNAFHCLAITVFYK